MARGARETVERMPQNVRFVLEDLRKTLRGFPERKDTIREKAYGYTLGLRDAGFITERERQMLFIYSVTVFEVKK